MNIFNKEQIAFPDVFAAELLHRLCPDVFHHFRGKLLGRQIVEPGCGSGIKDLVDNRLGQMALAKPGAAVHKQTVAIGKIILGQGVTGSAGKDIALADHEMIEGVGRMQGTDAALGKRCSGQTELTGLLLDGCGLGLVGNLERNGKRTAGNLIGHGSDTVKITFFNPGTEKTVRGGNPQFLLIFPFAGKRFNPEAKFIFRKLLLQ